MNEVAKIEQPIHGLVPGSMSEAMRLAEMMASAKLVPQGLQKSPADCLMVIQQAIRWQMDPFAVAQECSVIQGKLMHSGKLVAAVVNANGNLTQRLSFDYKGEGDNRTIVVSGQLQGEPSARVVDVILKNARTANKVWQTQPDQQLMYHGVRVWARRHTPELMLGVYSPEEFDEPAPARKMPPAAAKNVMLPAHDAETGEVEQSTPEQPDTSSQIGGGDYVSRWDDIMKGATDADQLAAKWNDEAAERKGIAWGEGQFIALQRKVKQAIDGMRTSA